MKVPATPYYPQKSNSLIKGFVLFLNKERKLVKNTFKSKHKELFYNQLSVLLEAGVDIKSSMEIIIDEQKNINIKNLLVSIKDKLIAGSSLSESLSEIKSFSNYEINSINIGEESGKLTVVLKELSIFYKSQIKQRRQIISALTYPAIVFITSFAAIFFMLNFIVPMFADIFLRFGGNLPFITKVILKLSNFISSYFYLLFIIIVSFVYLLYSQRKKTLFRKISTHFILKIPIIGQIVQKIYLTRFANSMKLLLGSKIPILRAIELVKNMIEYYPIEVTLSQIEQDILQGIPLNISLSKFNFYPKQMVSLIKVGEEVNKLDYFFEKIAIQYTDEVEHQTSVMSSLLEPFIIIFLGLIVGVILIAMYLPLFQLSSVL